MRILPILGAVASAVVAVMLAGVASADPDTPNPLDPSGLPNVNGLTPVSPLEYSTLADTAYGFTIPGGISCLIKRADASYGCSGPLPGAPTARTSSAVATLQVSPPPIGRSTAWAASRSSRCRRGPA
ncbi:hypothetical protein I542_2771 [Mycobacteroides abscessus 1948]|uniref:Uncharacterized protein n=1 Tax=Mycobacteroides abscessus 1948 TaxID=1299323 RepID=A0A829QJ81_9MYCO|nr:hypothetical protein I542_2771 [Mycobacteroides abscessus 1948]